MTASLKAMVAFMLRVCHALGRAFMVVACIMFSLLVLLVFAGSVLRYVVGTPLAIADETASLLFLSGSLGTLTYGYLEKKMIRISLIWDRLSDKWRLITDTLGTLVGAVVIGVIFWSTLIFAWDAYNEGARTLMTDIPLWPWAITVPLSLGLLTLSMFLTALDQLLDLLNDSHNLSAAKRSL